MEDFKERAKELVSKMTLAEKIAQMQHDAPAIERLGIPAYNWWNEALRAVELRLFFHRQLQWQHHSMKI
mgnify:CR=1 FL=1